MSVAKNVRCPIEGGKGRVFATVFENEVIPRPEKRIGVPEEITILEKNENLAKMQTRFNIPRFSSAGDERIRRSMERGNPGDDPRLPIRKISVRKDGNSYISWNGPIDYGRQDEALWEMEIDLHEFCARKTRQLPIAFGQSPSGCN